MKRKRRIGELTCVCVAYPFPHRMMGGACNGAAFVQHVFDTQLWSACKGCHLLEEIDGSMVCQALDGRETLQECPELQNHVRFNEIKLYGMNRQEINQIRRRRSRA